MPSISSTLILVDCALLLFIATKVKIPRRKEKKKTITAIPFKQKRKKSTKIKVKFLTRRTTRVSSDEGKDKDRAKTTKG